MKLVIIGGVAGGASAAARARRLDEKAEILLLERGAFISFANCGLPYYVGGVITDEDGDYPRWVELYNSTSAELSLSGYSLSDRENDATKYPLPAITLAPGEYRVVFLSGKNRTAADGNLHTGFKVNGSETLYLFSGSTIVDSVSGAATSSNISKIKVGSAWEETEASGWDAVSSEEGSVSCGASVAAA